MRHATWLITYALGMSHVNASCHIGRLCKTRLFSHVLTRTEMHTHTHMQTYTNTSRRDFGGSFPPKSNPNKREKEKYVPQQTSLTESST